jgi:uncharacterized membrane protein
MTIMLARTTLVTQRPAALTLLFLAAVDKLALQIHAIPQLGVCTLQFPIATDAKAKELQHVRQQTHAILSNANLQLEHVFPFLWCAMTIIPALLIAAQMASANLCISHAPSQTSVTLKVAMFPLELAVPFPKIATIITLVLPIAVPMDNANTL